MDISIYNDNAHSGRMVAYLFLRFKTSADDIPRPKRKATRLYLFFELFPIDPAFNGLEYPVVKPPSPCFSAGIFQQGYSCFPGLWRKHIANTYLCINAVHAFACHQSKTEKRIAFVHHRDVAVLCLLAHLDLFPIRVMES